MTNNKSLKIELRVAIFLRWGVFVAITLLLLGLFGILLRENISFADLEVYQSSHLYEQLIKVFHEKDYAILLIYLGLCCLILLPVLRVLMTAIVFYKEKERLLFGLSLCVLFLLMFSFRLGAVH